MRELPNAADAVKLPCIVALIKADAPDAELTEAQFLEIVEGGSVSADAASYGTQARRDLKNILDERQVHLVPILFASRRLF